MGDIPAFDPNAEYQTVPQAAPPSAPSAATAAQVNSTPAVAPAFNPNETYDTVAQAKPDEQSTFGKLFLGPSTAAGAPLSENQQGEASGVSEILHGDIAQGFSHILHAETPHVVSGSPIEKLIQQFKPDFRGSLTPEQAQDLHQKNFAGIENPPVDVAQFIDKSKYPVSKALFEAAQSMVSPSNVAVMASTGGFGLVESPKALAVANRLISAGFTANAVGQAYKNLKDFKAAYDKGDANEALYQLTHAVTSGTMAYIAGSHAANAPVLEAPGKAVTEPVTKALEERKAGKEAEAANEDMNAANQDFKKAIPPTKTNPYTDNDLVVANNYLEPQHEADPIRGVQHTVDALNSSIEGIENKISEAVNIIPNEPITTNVLDDVKSALEKNERGDEFVKAGMKEIEGLNLDNVNMSRADAIRRQLNLENKAILKKNNYDLAAARAADPGFAAREAASASLRKGIYDQFKEHGIEGSEELRQEEGSLLKVRDAAQAQVFNGDKVIKGSGGGTLGRRMAGRGVQAVTTAIGAGGGAAMAGVPGAVAGGAIGAELGGAAREAIVPQDLTRDEVIERRFKDRQAATGQPGGVTVNLRAPAEPETPAGTQQTIPPPIPGATPGEPAQPSLFGKTSTNPTKATGESAPGSDLNLESRYQVPTESAVEIPANKRNRGEFSRDTHIAEWGHVTNGALEGFETKGIKSHLHPTLEGTSAQAAAGFKTNIDWKDPQALEKNSGRLLSTMMGHAAAQELHSGIPFEMNESVQGDINQVKLLAKTLGMSDDDADGMIRYGLDRAKRNLTQPGISDRLLENVDRREPGLDPTMHASPERTEAYANEIRRIRDENRQAAGQPDGVRGNNVRDAEGTNKASEAVDAGTEGKGAAGDTEGNLEAASEVVQEAKKSGGGFVADLRTGKPTDTGFLVEMMPEKRLKLDHDATPKDIQKFYNDNRQLFKQHPELRIGGYKDELNISAHTDDQPTAERLAKKLDQRSVWDVKKGQEIPTGGRGETTEFKDYPFEKRIKELRGK